MRTVALGNFVVAQLSYPYKKMEAGTNTSDRCSLVSSHTVILSIFFRHYMGDFVSGLPSKDAVSLLTEYVCRLFKN